MSELLFLVVGVVVVFFEGGGLRVRAKGLETGLMVTTWVTIMGLKLIWGYGYRFFGIVLIIRIRNI